MDFLFLPTWHEFLPRAGGHIVSLFGAGGKTSLLLACAEVYRDEGVPVVLTTTTRTEPLAVAGLPVVEWRDLAAGTATDPTTADVFFLRDGVDPQGKWLGPDARDVDALGRLLPDRVVLAEVDGAAKHPVKLHRDDEPVWPRRTSLAVAVLGARALGRPVGEVLFRWDSLPASQLTELHDDDEWTWQHMFRLLTTPGGYLSRVPPGVPTLLAITQLASIDDTLGLFDFVARVMNEAALPLIVIGEARGGRTDLRTVYRDSEENGDG